MIANFDNIFQYRIPMNDFILKWRFIDEKYDKLPELHLEQLIPLSKEASNFLWDYIGNTNLHKDIPFKEDFFRTICTTNHDSAISYGNSIKLEKLL